MKIGKSEDWDGAENIVDYVHRNLDPIRNMSEQELKDISTKKGNGLCLNGRKALLGSAPMHQYNFLHRSGFIHKQTKLYKEILNERDYGQKIPKVLASNTEKRKFSQRNTYH